MPVAFLWYRVFLLPVFVVLLQKDTKIIANRESVIHTNLLPLTDAQVVYPTFPFPGFGVGTLCVDDEVVGFPETSLCAA